MKRYVFDFAVTLEDGTEKEFHYTVEVASAAEAAALWDDLLAVLPAGDVGGGIYPVEDEDE